jgi:hypothetical protein
VAGGAGTGTTYGLAHVSGKKQKLPPPSHAYEQVLIEVTVPSPGGVVSQTIAVVPVHTFASAGSQALHMLRVRLQPNVHVVFVSPQVGPEPAQVTRFDPVLQKDVAGMHG